MQANLVQARANLTKARSELDRARVQLTDAQQKYARAKELASQQLLAASELDAAKIAVDSATAAVASQQATVVQVQAAVTQSEASVNQSQVNRDHTVILAPIDGIVTQRSVDVGQTVAASMSGADAVRDRRRPDRNAGQREHRRGRRGPHPARPAGHRSASTPIRPTTSSAP